MSTEVGHGCGKPILFMTAVVTHRYLIHGRQQGITHSKLYLKMCLRQSSCCGKWERGREIPDRLWGHPIELSRCCEENRVAVSFMNLLHQAGMGFSMRQFPFFFFIIKNVTCFHYMLSLLPALPKSTFHSTHTV